MGGTHFRGHGTPWRSSARTPRSNSSSPAGWTPACTRSATAPTSTWRRQRTRCRAMKRRWFCPSTATSSPSRSISWVLSMYQTPSTPSSMPCREPTCTGWPRGVPAIATCRSLGDTERPFQPGSHAGSRVLSAGDPQFLDIVLSFSRSPLQKPSQTSGSGGHQPCFKFLDGSGPRQCLELLGTRIPQQILPLQAGAAQNGRAGGCRAGPYAALPRPKASGSPGPDGVSIEHHGTAQRAFPQRRRILRSRRKRPRCSAETAARSSLTVQDLEGKTAPVCIFKKKNQDSARVLEGWLNTNGLLQGLSQWERSLSSWLQDDAFGRVALDRPRLAEHDLLKPTRQSISSSADMDNATLTPRQWDETSENIGDGCPLQASFQYSLFTVIYSTVFVLGLLENGAALYLLACRVQKNAPRSYIFLVNIAVVDAFFAGILPFKIHYHFHHNDWVFGDVACRITGCMYFLNIYLSIAFFTCVCVDRYVAVLHPFAYIRIKSGHYKMAVAALWVMALSVTGPLVLGGPLHARVSNTTVCFENFQPASWTGRMVPYNICALVFGFAIPFAIILISYPLIARRIARIPRSARKKKALGTIYLVLLICMTCFLPYHVTHLLHFLMRAGFIENCPFAAFIYKMRRVTLALVSFNCCLNPILYFFTAARWRWPFRIWRRSVRVYTIDRDRNARHGSAQGEVEQNRQNGDGMRLPRPPQTLVGL